MNEGMKGFFRAQALKAGSTLFRVSWWCRHPAVVCLTLVCVVGASTSGVVVAAPNTWAAHFTSISVGADFSCGILAGEHAVCWGNNGSNQTDVPSGNFSQVTAGYGSACGLHPDGRVACWGMTYGWGPPKGKQFSTLNSGWGYPCGIERSSTKSGPVVCFGAGAGWRPFGPRSFTGVSAGGEAVCGITTYQSIRCLSPPGALPASFLPDDIPHGRFTSVNLGLAVNAGFAFNTDTACAIRTDRSLVCWGNDQFGQTRSPSGPFMQVGVGSGFACGLRVSRIVVCWGSPKGSGLGRPPAGQFQQVSVGEGDACALRSNGTAVCWGSNQWGADEVPSAPFTSASTSDYYGCALRADSSLACWGMPQASTPGLRLSGRFRQVNASGGGICAIRFNRSVLCWTPYPKADDPIQKDVPSGKFVDVSAGGGGGGEACAVRATGDLACWGSDAGVKPPNGSFVRVDVGQETACAIRTNGTLACWRVYPGAPAYPVPPGRFKQVQVDAGCGLKTSGTVTCWWGADPSDGVAAGSQVMPGKYVQMAARGVALLTCGLTSQGTIRCGFQCTWASPECAKWHWSQGQWTAGRYTAIASSVTGGLGNEGELCAIRVGGSLVCWGDSNVELATASASDDSSIEHE